MNRVRMILLTTLWASSCAFGQLWSSVLNPARAIDWTVAGAGTIPTTRTQCGSTIGAYTGTAATINNAIAACGANQYVKLGAGTFTLSTGVTFAGKDNVTLRGSGPDSTFLVINGDVNCGLLWGGCMRDSTTADITSPPNQANWTAGYSQGTTSITLGANSIGSTKPAVGWLLYLDQLNDSTTDTGNVWVCVVSPTCTQAGGQSGTHGVGSIRAQFQIVTVTSISAGSCPCTGWHQPGPLYAELENGTDPTGDLDECRSWHRRWT